MEHPAKTFTALDLSNLSSDFDPRIDDPIVKALVISFPMIIMGHELFERAVARTTA